MRASAWIDVERTKGGWRDRVRAYKVMIDGRQVGAIRQGEERSFEVGPGTHEVFLKIDWCRSPKLSVDIAGGQRPTVSWQPGAGRLWTFILDPTSYIRAELTT